jgi:isopenicillin-N N-acyltransferase-like protein
MDEVPTGLKVVGASGTFDRMGYEVGRQCKALAAELLRLARVRLDGMNLTWDKALQTSSKFLPYAEAYDPEHCDFIKGYAEGSGQSFDDLFVHFCFDEKGFCTDLMVNDLVTADGSVLAAHSEDWSPIYDGRVVMLKGRPKSGPSFASLGLCGLEFDCGMNSAGLSFSGNTLYHNDIRIGIPRMFVSRRILTSRNLAEAISSAVPDRRASSYNHNLCHADGDMFCIEGSATDFAAIHGTDGYLVHTNHYLSPKMGKYETLFQGPGGNSPGNGIGSLARYHRAHALLRRHLGEVTHETLTSIMSDHQNHPASICCHPNLAKPLEDRSETIFVVVFDLGRRKMLVCPGNPCEHGFVEHALSE